MRHAAGKLAGALHLNRIRKITNKLRGKKKEKEEPAEVEQEDAQEEKEEEEEQVEDLDDLLQAEPEYEEEDMDDILAEQEYEEVGKCKDGSTRKKGKACPATSSLPPPPVPPPPKIRSQEDDDDGADDAGFQQAVDELEISDAQALNHLVAFKGKFDDIRTRVMKGKARYIEKLQAYLDGDENAEVRMYNGTKLRIANLNPNRESLLKALQAFPSGPHFIECD